MATLTDLASLESAVRKAAAQVTITDIHTHLFPVSHGELLLWGIDEVLRYHYLVAELFTVAGRSLTPQRFWGMSPREQADQVWQHLFIDRGPLSEAARGVLTTLNALGLDVGRRDLEAARRWFDQQKVGDYLPRVFELAGIDYAVMTNNPFDAEEAGHWQRGAAVPDYLKPALRVDPLIWDWPAAAAAMRAAGYTAADAPDAASCAQARRFLADWAGRMKPLYLAASLGWDFAYPADTVGAKVLEDVLVAAARDLGLPLALMVGVRRQVNPALVDGGDGVGVADVGLVQHLCAANPDVKFLATFLSRVNQHELCVLARKFGNLHIFGCWWFCNDPSIIEEMTRMRIELLGTAFTCQHSDARVLDQLIYKWAHSRQVVADVLVEKFGLQFAAGWRPTAEEIRRDVRAIFGGSFEQFLAK
jgi:hypothetical protein